MCEAGCANIANVAHHMWLRDRTELHAFDETPKTHKNLRVTRLSMEDFTGAHLSIGGLYQLSTR
tara:strand:- start:1406 stop:1597 length:192 start_codon:yes stop_codon:yes gene_type:complete